MFDWAQPTGPRWEPNREEVAEQQANAVARDADQKHQQWQRETYASGIERLHQIVEDAGAKGMTDHFVGTITVRQAKDLLRLLGASR
jgi:hypothetical protein